MSEIRDPIHGFITPGKLELKIIDTSLFQRLRRIKQLAMAYLVYPGAIHTRFAHSLGVYHIASLMADKLLPDKKNEEKRQIIRLSALLHDIGHGPFSHVSEDLLNKYADTKGDDEKEKIHERITAKLIKNNLELKKLLSLYERNNIIGLLSGDKIDISLMKDIVSGPLDADKMDYLLRDSYFCGVKYGMFDLHRILNTLTSYKDNFDEYMGISYDGINSLEQFILAKYYITTQVYRHKVRSVSDAMIIRGIELGIERDEIDFLKKLYCYKDTDDYLDNYVKYWDNRIVNELLFSDKKGYASDIFERLYKRNLFKRIFSEKLDELEKETRISENLKDQLINSKENENLKKDIEQKVSVLKSVRCEKEYVIVNSFTIKPAGEISRDPKSEGEVMTINNETKEKKRFDEESTIFSSISEKMRKDIYFEVYAPLKYEGEKEKPQKLGILTKEIIGILKGG